MHEHISIWDTRLQTGGVVRIRLYVIYAHLGNHILLRSGGGTGAQLCTPQEVWALGVGMSTLDAQTAVRRGSGVPSTDDPGA